MRARGGLRFHPRSLVHAIDQFLHLRAGILELRQGLTVHAVVVGLFLFEDL